MRRAMWTSVRIAGPLVCLAGIVWRVGTGPIAAGISSVDGRALATATAIAVFTTACCAWRWTVVARAFGMTLSLRSAVAAYYRSQFLNVTLPGGVVGDVHRGVAHGREIAGVSDALRAVVVERCAGQVVQLVLTVVVLLVLPSPVQSSMPLVTLVLVVVAAIVGVAVLRRKVSPASRAESCARRLTRRQWCGVALASAAVVAGHAITFLIAARTAGATASVPRMLPLALLAMTAMALPSVAGWGPREGVAAWVFAAAGLGAGRGVATGVVYGVMVLVATLPGALVLVVSWFRQLRRPERQRPSLREGAAHA